MTARDQARQWLAEVLHQADECPCSSAAAPDCRWAKHWTQLADAILDAPGVQVGAIQLPPRHEKVVIRLPAIPRDAANDRPSVHADGRTGAGESDGTRKGAQGDLSGPTPPEIMARNLNRPMVARLRRCAADTTPNWDGQITIYPPEARDLLALIDSLLTVPIEDGRDERPAFPPADVIARRFHETYERLAPEYGYRTREASAKPWDDVPEQNRALMIHTAREVRNWLLDPDGRDG